MSDSKRISRRHFLFAAGAGGAAATVMVAGRKPEPSAQPAKSPPASNGYHVTEHIRNYYRTTKV